MEVAQRSGAPNVISQETLESWVADFKSPDLLIRESIVVMPQDSTDGENSGLVGVRLQNATTPTWIEPSENDGSWAVTFAAREDTLVSSSAEVAGLAAELAETATLCEYLETRARQAAARRTPESVGV